jgi:hypothetical protein
MSESTLAAVLEALHVSRPRPTRQRLVRRRARNGQIPTLPGPCAPRPASSPATAHRAAVPSGAEDCARKFPGSTVRCWDGRAAMRGRICRKAHGQVPRQGAPAARRRWPQSGRSPRSITLAWQAGGAARVVSLARDCAATHKGFGTCEGTEKSSYTPLWRTMIGWQQNQGAAPGEAVACVVASVDDEDRPCGIRAGDHGIPLAGSS